jgi:putative hemolysin
LTLSVFFLIFGLITLTALSGILSASETALFSLPSSKLRSYKKEGNPRQKMVYSLLKRPQDLLVTILFLNVLVNILAQNFASTLFGDVSSWALKVGVPLCLTLIFGEIVPKVIAIQNNALVANSVAPGINKIRLFLGPLRKSMSAITEFLSRYVFFFLKRETEISKHELQHALKASERSGILSSFEQELLHGYLDLQDDTVKEHMRPREEMLTFDLRDPLKELEKLFLEEGCSKIPVYDENLENIQGIITARSYFLNNHIIETSIDIIPHIQRPLFVPISMPAKTLLKKLSENYHPLAIVVDEYGSISGLISREDLVEVVVGEIQDQRDTHKRYSQASENSLIASGKLELAEFEEIFSCTLANPHNRVTVGGWLIAELGDIPPSGSKFIKEEFLFQVLSADEKKIRRLYIRRFDKPTSTKKAKKDE